MYSSVAICCLKIFHMHNVLFHILTGPQGLCQVPIWSSLVSGTFLHSKYLNTGSMSDKTKKLSSCTSEIWRDLRWSTIELPLWLLVGKTVWHVDCAPERTEQDFEMSSARSVSQHKGEGGSLRNKNAIPNKHPWSCSTFTLAS